MREFVLVLVIASVFSCIGWASTMIVSTGYGYYTYNGQPIVYYNLKPGNYTLDNRLSYVETSSPSNISINQTAASQFYGN